jgi:hypothetical protein
MRTARRSRSTTFGGAERSWLRQPSCELSGVRAHSVVRARCRLVATIDTQKPRVDRPRVRRCASGFFPGMPLSRACPHRRRPTRPTAGSDLPSSSRTDIPRSCGGQQGDTTITSLILLRVCIPLTLTSCTSRGSRSTFRTMRRSASSPRCEPSRELSGMCPCRTVRNRRRLSGSLDSNASASSNSSDGPSVRLGRLALFQRQAELRPSCRVLDQKLPNVWRTALLLKGLTSYCPTRTQSCRPPFPSASTGSDNSSQPSRGSQPPTGSNRNPWAAMP